MESRATKYVYSDVVCSGNGMLHVVDSVDVNNANREGLVYKAELWLPKAYKSAEFSKVFTYRGHEVPAEDRNGTLYYAGCEVWMGEYVSSLLRYTVPPVGAAIHLNSNAVQRYKVRSYAERDGILVAGSESWTSVRYAIKAAVSDADWAERFMKTVAETNGWLDVISEHEVARTTPVYANVLLNMNPKPEVCKLKVRVNYNDGSASEQVVRSWVPDAYALYSVGVGYGQLGLAANGAGAAVHNYEVWILDEDDKRLTEPIRVLIDNAIYRNDTVVMARSERGGWASVRMHQGGSMSLMESASMALTRSKDFKKELYMYDKVLGWTVKLSTGVVLKADVPNVLQLLASEQLYILRRDLDAYDAAVKVSDDVTEVLDDDDYSIIGADLKLAKEPAAVLPIAASTAGAVVRPTVWLPEGVYCLIDEYGKRTGYAGAVLLVQHYADVTPYEKVKGVAGKSNTPDTDGYIAPVLSAGCVVGTAAFSNVAISRVGSHKRNNCGVGFTGVETIIAVPAGLYGGASQADADDAAEQEWTRRDTQEAANANAQGCVLAPENYSATIPSGKAMFRWSDIRTSGAYADNAVSKYGAGNGYSGNGWWGFEPAYVPVERYGSGTNDIVLNASYAPTEPWRFTIYDKALAESMTVKIYVNAVEVASATSAEVVYIDVPHNSIVAGDRVYVKVI